GERLDEAADALPPGVGKPMMGPQSSILGEIMIIGLTADSTSMLELRRIAEKTIRPRLLALGGVSQVSVIGGDAPEYRINLDPEMMKLYDVSLDDVMAATDGFNANAGGGVLYDFGNEYIVKAQLNTTEPSELGSAVVKAGADGSVVTIADIATVDVGPRLPRLGVASVKATPAVIVTVTKQPGAGTIQLTESIDKALAELQTTMPHDITVSTDIFRQSEFISNSISNLQRTLLEGAFFVVLVLFFFLMNLRTTLISIVALPLSIIVTVLILNALGYTVNTMSLGGIAIAIGCLVDDAIVDVENVYKRIRENAALPKGSRRPLLKVVYEASAEVRMPIFNSTLIIAAAFLPLFFLTGMEGRMLKPLGVSFLVALAASTIVALTVTPVLCSFLLGKRKENEELSREPRVTAAMKKAYSRSLEAALSHKKTLLAGTAVLFVAALGLFFTLGRGFLPPFNEGSFTINVSTLPGISLEESDKIGREAERIILETPEVLTVARKTGRAELDEHSLGVNVSEIEAPYRLTDRRRGEVARDLRSRLGEIPGAVVEIGQPISHRIDAMLSGSQAQIAIKIFGSDLERLYTIGKQVKEAAESVPGLVDINIEQQTERPQLLIRPRRDALALHGIRLGDFGKAIETIMGGTVVAQVYEDGFAYDVAVIAADGHRDRLDKIGTLTLDGVRGKVALAEVADIISTTGPNTVNRENVKRRLLVSANVDGGDLSGSVEKLREKIEETVTLPENYYISYGGQFENEQAASRTLLWTSLGALLIIFMLLYGEFKNAAEAAVILVNMPLALIGGIFMLTITGGELNIPAIIGFISLMGISTRNGMLLITRYKHLKDEGETLAERIAHGSSDRLLPIIMTALTSALALIPLAVNGSAAGNEIQAPMAIVILGGLISSTALNIYVVPTLYQYLNRKESNR
ncbi:MAG: efflux RND transporter permease subunit, partial [Muribaculaceae bacterium]|nr:efflux RND transporter permease subunit [Muribaculaceae bacterium]